jgi:phospholipid/cholesterol/gamma-HCH transport system ATP-binding protein
MDAHDSRSTDPTEEHVRVDALSVRYGERQVLENVALTVNAGEIVVVMGRSGCGKTTLLKALIGLIRPDAGSVAVLGRSLAEMDEDALDEFRERIGMLFQFGALINSFTVGENILLPLRRRCVLDEETARSVAQLKLAMVGLPEVFDLYPAQLSGGMKKRAGFARALILDPDILFFDEPTSGLDPNTAAEMDELILSLRQDLKTTMVVVTHDLASAFTIADRIVMMHDGRMVAEGTADVLRASDDPVVKSFVERRGNKGESAARGRTAEFFV